MQNAKLAMSLAAVGLITALSGCAPSGSAQAGAAALSPKQTAMLDKELTGKVAGKPMNCLSDMRNSSTIRVSDDILLYRVSGKLVYRNDLRGGCPGLARDDDVMVIEKYGSQTCRGDIFYLVDRVSGIRGPSCTFGEFVPYSKPRGDES
jgi:hypothetical protein